MIALNDLARHHAPLRAALEAALARVHDRGWYILGPEVEAFEREFAAYVGVAECIAVGNGTDALELALRALAIGPGDAVATVANAGMYATTAIRAAGAVPAYVEIDESTLQMDRRGVRRRCRTEAARGDRHASLRSPRRRRTPRPHRTRARDRADRGLRAGARRESRRRHGRHVRDARLLQLLSDEEPRARSAMRAPSSPATATSRRNCARCGPTAGAPSTIARWKAG